MKQQKHIEPPSPIVTAGILRQKEQINQKFLNSLFVWGLVFFFKVVGLPSSFCSVLQILPNCRAKSQPHRPTCHKNKRATKRVVLIADAEITNTSVYFEKPLVVFMLKNHM